ncbi:hypothetical protein PTTG_29955, partial [Puccinia triticina 1-1 BBBD Race 1]
MDGYKECNWDTLRTAMIKTWGKFDDSILYTRDDLFELAEQQAQQGIINYLPYRRYIEKFTTILEYLVKNKQINKEDNTGLLFLSAFSVESQQSIKCILVSKDQLPKAKDGSNKAPLWEHLVEAVETEMIQIEEGYVEENNRAWELASLKRKLEFSEDPITGNTEPEIDCAEPVMEVMETEPESCYQESVFEQVASTIQLPGMTTNWKAAMAKFMDTAMELKHTVIEIPDFGSDSVDTAIS